MQLNCSASDCIHNKSSNCYARVIQVSRDKSPKSRNDAFCNSYSKDNSVFQNTAVEHMGYPTIGDGISTEEYSGEFIMPEDSKITCNASDCANNQKFECCAENVDITFPHNMKCECKTFCKK